MIPFALACLASVLIILGLVSSPPPLLTGLVVLGLVVSGILSKRLRAVAFGCVVAILMLSVTFTWLSARQLQAEHVGSDVQVLLRVDSVPTRRERHLRFEATLIECESCEVPLGPTRVRLHWYGATSLLRAGERWRMTLRLKPIAGLQNAGGFDRVAWAMANALHAEGQVRSKPAPERVAAAEGNGVSVVRERLAANLAALPSGGQSLALVQALTLGLREGVSEATWQVLRNSGTAHLLSISGLHITLVAAWVYLLVFSAGRLVSRFANSAGSLPDLWLMARMISLLAALIYALLSGFALPAQRALIMLSIWGIAGIRMREMPARIALALTLMAVLLRDPLSVLSVSFWLSFGTVAALFYLHAGRSTHNREASLPGRTPGLWGRYRGLIQRVLGAVRTHICLGILLLPVTAWYFHSGSIIAPLANLLAVPWVALVVVPLCFLTLLSSLVWLALADFCLQLSQASIAVLIRLLSALVDSSWAALSLAMPSAASTFLCVLGLLLLFAPRGLGVGWLSLPLVLPALVFNLARAPITGFEAHVLDVGQGLAVLVFSENDTLLFDTGGRLAKNRSMFEAVVMPFLRASGRRGIDTLVVSHSDEDHSFGVSDVLARFPHVRVISSALPAAMNSTRDREPERCQAGMHWRDGDTVFTFLHPGKHDTGSDNDLSCVLLVHHGAARVLLTGDIEAAAEARLAARLQAARQLNPSIDRVLRVDMMTAPHHGSNTSSTHRLLAAIQAETVVFPAGRGNRYGFPHVHVQSRYLAMGVNLFTTGTDGAVSFSAGRTGVGQSPSSWRQSHRRFWHGIVNPTCFGHGPDRSLGWRWLWRAHEEQELCGKLSLQAAG